ncbi:hypothetical protein C8035_v005662 [Colletotrichum spinosum]|uniref:Uncharacterized protein n=1 Tax=Colletotrichum spinosum TaxID=1347390 RepID=A0A4R8QLF1_9PEZI|nr:hypothetical protein C8035_v005662 [Colletotrichum spinosum]
MVASPFCPARPDHRSEVRIKYRDTTPFRLSSPSSQVAVMGAVTTASPVQFPNSIGAPASIGALRYS